jgi:hypothetical protein
MPIRSKPWTSVDIGMKAKPDNPAAAVFLVIAAQTVFEALATTLLRQPRIHSGLGR